MDKYSYRNVITRVRSEKAKKYVGKTVYYADSPPVCLSYANSDDATHRGILQRVEVGQTFPFVIGNSSAWMFIIPCEEEEPESKYIPFENAEEFLNAYYHSEIENFDSVYHSLANHGIWLKYKCDKTLVVQCMEISDAGVNIGIDSMLWCDLFEDYTFLDGTPCGRLKERSDE